MIVDLNADLGEGSGHDRELLELITSANISCGFHAGDASTILETLKLAAAAGVVVGAHPGHADREHFGRREQPLREDDVLLLGQYQVGALMGLTKLCNLTLQFLKPHGALYHQACRDITYARPLASVARAFQLKLVGLPGSVLETCAESIFIAEGFIDRRYRPDGLLVPRTEPNALLDDPREAVAQAEWLCRERGVRTLCVHGDSPGAIEFTARVREHLLACGFEIRPFA